LENGVKIGFADDTIVKIRSNTIEDLELKANNAVKILSDWAKRSKLSFNASKTKCVLFTKRLKYNKPKIL
jgi:hypothetical protein